MEQDNSFKPFLFCGVRWQKTGKETGGYRFMEGNILMRSLERFFHRYLKQSDKAYKKKKRPLEQIKGALGGIEYT